MYPKMKVMRSERHSDLEEAVHKRLSRKQLPRVTDDGYVEYGLRVPQDIGGLFPQHRQHGNPAAAATRSRRDPQVRFASTCLLHVHELIFCLTVSGRIHRHHYQYVILLLCRQICVL